MSERPRASREPQDRLTRICDQMTKTFDMHPEHRPDDRCMVFLDDGKMGGLVIHGYESQTDAITDLLMHLRAMFRSAGKEFDIMFMGDDGIDRI
jgi:hypothetical protein